MDRALAPDRWQQIDRLFSAALDRPEAQRVAFVTEACGGDLELRGAVLELLEASPQAERYWEGARARLIRSLWTGFADEEAAGPGGPQGDRLGPYRLLNPIARGGMGTVYLAARADGRFEQRLAVKVLRKGLDTEDVVARFLAERRILASLEHPNIARLLDGGETPDGRPYLAMEYVEGRPITEYCDAVRMPLPARLVLFESVCRTVHHAHQHLVVHRDLKPSNILVTPTGQVKLLDFGIAKLLDPQDPDTPAGPTRTGVRLMTPRYASPEQVLGKRVTTASDVYQLGLLLYELVAGRPPYPEQELSRAELERLISEVEPPPPSEVVDASTAHLRRLDLRGLRRSLGGDLDRITQMALRKEPERRYSSAEQLLEDVRRFRHGLPVQATADTRSYRAAKFLRRHQFGVAAATAGVLFLAGYALTVTEQSRTIRSARDQAALEARKAEQVTAFMVDLFGGANPDVTGGRDVTVRELLDLGAQRAGAELSDQPAVRSAMLSAIGQSYAQLGRYDAAQPLLEIALAERRLAHGPIHEAVARDLWMLAGVVAKSDLDTGIALYGDALRVAEAGVGPDHPLVGRILADYGERISLARPGDSLSIALRERAVAILRAAPGDVREDLAHALSVSAYGAPPAVALPRMREALALRRALYGEQHTTVAASLNDLALATEPVDPLAADSLMTKSIEIAVAILGKRHATTLNSMNSLAALRRTRGAYELAEPIYREVLALREELYPDQRLLLAYSQYGLGLVLAEQDKGADAETYLRLALGNLERELAADSPLLALTRLALGHALASQGRYQDAERLLVSANDAIQASGLPALDKARALQRVVRLYLAWSRPDRAEPYQEQLRQLVEAESLSGLDRGTGDDSGPQPPRDRS